MEEYEHVRSMFVYDNVLPVLITKLNVQPLSSLMSLVYVYVVDVCLSNSVIEDHEVR